MYKCNKNQLDNFYVNLQINGAGVTDQVATYKETLSAPILDRTDTYYLAICRFDVPTDRIPTLQFPVDILQNNPNISNCVIGVQTSLGAQFPTNVMYTPGNNYPVPQPGGSSPYFTSAQTSSLYYGIFGITPFLNMINQALVVASVNAGLSIGDFPYFTYDNTSQLISLHVPPTFFTHGAFTIFMNQYMQNFLATFNLFIDTTITPTQGNQYRFILTHTATTPLDSFGNYLFVEDTVSIALWYDLKRIVITTSTMPIIQEVTPSGSSSNNIGNGGVLSYQQILTDVSVNNSDVSINNGTLIYLPQPQYRLVNMVSTSPLDKLDFTFMWADSFGNLNNLYISPSASASIKFGFFKKYLYSNEKCVTET